MYEKNDYDNRYDLTPISMWGYFLYQILFAIPLVGLILLIVFSFGGTRNINLRNFARSYFCAVILACILFLILYIVGGVAFITEVVQQTMA